jgi:hypothetical protein
VAGNCVSENAACPRDAGLCQAGSCGGAGGIYQPLYGSSGSLCTQAYVYANLDAGLCEACGGSGQPCCTNYINENFFETCGQGYSCQGGGCSDAGCQGGTCQ